MRGIISGDNHIRADLPRCRIDDNWEETQNKAIIELVEIANKKDCDLFIVGDLFDTANVPARIISMLINEFSKINNKVYILAGNHDLPYHSITNIENSSIGIFRNLSRKHHKIKFGMTEFGHWSNFNGTVKGSESGILFIHKLIFDSAKSIPPNCAGITAAQFLEENKYKWVFSSDNHKCFHYEKNDRHIINPGCMIRQSSDEKEYKPSVFFVDTEKEIVERIYLNDNVEMVDDSYIKKENERDERIGAFVEQLKSSKKLSLSFLDNIEKAIEKNKKVLDKSIIDMINTLIQGE